MKNTAVWINRNELAVIIAAIDERAAQAMDEAAAAAGEPTGLAHTAQTARAGGLREAATIIASLALTPINDDEKERP